MKKVLFLFCCVALVFAVTATAQAALITEAEPNDTFVTAQALSPAFFDCGGD